ncbi:tellurite resistance TerB family protein [Maritalea mediterranea]|uniref:Tellurite resistance TerB family protein n=1 Tax=Maritalea mediterranea TaxID=2909667 RepID=A0ABS9E436_9HYPH|nr:tellurite resistance TerB family protein [Maritalea mediterranea]MCF4097643.1 tellurite resistance TerB family protein [Maritalea mediterranea]
MSLSPQEALIYIMVVTSAADRKMSDREMKRIGSVVRQLPVFQDFSEDSLPLVAADCAKMLDKANDLQSVIDEITRDLPSHLNDTAYAMAVEIAAADLQIRPEESRVLDLLRMKFGLDRLTSSAIERAAQARHRVV